MKIRERLLWVTEHITRLALWSLTIAVSYGILVWTLNYVSNPEIVVHIRIAIGSGVITLAGLFLIFILDEECFG